jgi:hypothetical protein
MCGQNENDQDAGQENFKTIEVPDRPTGWILFRHVALQGPLLVTFLESGFETSVLGSIASESVCLWGDK